MSEKYDSIQKGKVVADKNILLSIIRIATKETAGVASIASTFSHKIKGTVSSNVMDGVEIKYDKKGRLVIDVYVILHYNYNVSEVSHKIQKNIKNSVASMIEYVISNINVHVVDVILEPYTE